MSLADTAGSVPRAADLRDYRELFGLRHPEAFFIGGRWHGPADATRRLDVVHPANERVVASMPEACIADVERAVAAARHAFDRGPWPRMSPAERGAVLRRVASLCEQRARELGQAWTLEMGNALQMAQYAGIGARLMFEYYAGLAETWRYEDPRPRDGGTGVVVHEPVGVVAAIVPWNAPLGLSCLKLAPALAAGCSVVLKPAPETPLYSWILGEIFEEAGLPAGVVNIVPAGREVGDHLIRHAGIDKVSFTGSTAAGRHIASVCAQRVARVQLELGGKSAALVLDDADPEQVVPNLVPHFTLVSGQICAGLTRILVPRGRRDDYVEALRTALAQITVGDPFDPATKMGPLAMRRQYERVLGYVDGGVAEGARLICGGRRPAHPATGYFIEPTLFADVHPRMRIAQEEVFGPFASLIVYDSLDEAIEIANDSIYGLNGAVFTPDADRAYSLARRFRCGNVTHNGWVFDFRFPFGGFKQSGLGREGGPEGFQAYLESKTVYLQQPPAHLHAGRSN